MTPRQQRRAQQKAQRKAQKLETRRQTQIVRETSATALPLHIGFESQNARPQPDPAKQIGFESQNAVPHDDVTPLGFESQNADVSALETGFESQTAASTAKPPVSQARLAANRANAQRSCGAKTVAGKRIVSQNRTRHGLTGEFRVLSNESQTDFDHLLHTFLAEHDPADETETELVQRMAEALWLSRRALRLQDACVEALQFGTEQEKLAARKELPLLLRYQTTHDLSFTRYSNELRKRSAERRKIERGFESQTLRQAQENRRQEKHEMDILLSLARLKGAKLPSTPPRSQNLVQAQAA